MRLFKFLAPVAAVLVIAGCGGGPSHRIGVSGHPCTPNNYYMQCATKAPGQNKTKLQAPYGSAFGVDFAWGGPPPSFLASNGFGISYLSGSSKDWSYGLLHAYLNNGRKIGFVWEISAKRAEYGCAVGAADARYANYLVGRYGFSTGANGPVIFFAVDTDTSAGSVYNYFACAHSVLGHRTGVYGGYRVVSVLGGVTGYCWQTVAWSYGSWSGRCGLRQYSINNYWHGYSVDYDLQVAADAGLYPSAAPPPVDKYAIFPKTRFALGSKQHASEYNTVRTWDQARCSNPARRVVCKTTRYHLTLLAGRLWTVAHQGHCLASSGICVLPDWKTGRRGARFQLIEQRLNARRPTSL